MQTTARASRGYTLIEVLIVVAILSLLASIAVPQLLRMQLRARRAEVAPNLKALAVAHLDYYHQHHRLVDCDPSPASIPGRTQAFFDETVAGWDDLAWRPDGKVYCQYYCQKLYGTGGAEWVRSHALCDLDGDGEVADWFVDIDPTGASSTSQHLVIRPSTYTSLNNRF
jgi:prepilin-type N-terminal cleavage/methylation domain-containing protein